MRVVGNLHQGADDDEHTSSGVWWDGSEDRCEEDGDEEAETRCHGSETGGTTLRYTGAGFDVSCDRGGAEQSPNRDAEGVDQIGDSRAFEILRLLVDSSAESLVKR